MMIPKILGKKRGKKTGQFTSAFAKGLAGETKAARTYEKLGYRLVARRAKTPAGEIDLILLDPAARCLVFVEVKARQDIASAAYAISPAQQRRLLRAADTWVGGKPAYAGFALQFDAFLIDAAGQTRRIENAFSLA